MEKPMHGQGRVSKPITDGGRQLSFQKTRSGKKEKSPKTFHKRFRERTRSTCTSQAASGPMANTSCPCLRQAWTRWRPSRFRIFIFRRQHLLNRVQEIGR